MAIARPSRGGSAINMYPLKPPLVGPKRQYLSIHHATLAPLDPPPEDINQNMCSIEENTSSPPQSSSQPRASIFSQQQKVTIFNQQQKEIKEAPVSATKPLFAPNSALSSSLPAPSVAKTVGNAKYGNNNNSISNKHQQYIPPQPSKKIAAPQNRTTVGFALNAPANRGPSSNYNNGPIVDQEVPSVIRLAAAQYINLDVKFDQIPSLPSINDPKFEYTLRKKLEICECILDFTDPNNQVQEKETKARTMCELIELFENNREINNLSETMQTAIFKMLETNIFTQDPQYQTNSYNMNMSKVEFSLSIIEPSWPHLFYCYQILNRFIQVFPNSKHINLDTAKNAIRLTQLPDTNERMQLVAFLRTFFDTHPNDRIKLLTAIKVKLIDLIEGEATPYCAMPLIILLTHMYSRTHPPVTMEFLGTLREAVLPLIGLHCFPMFHQNLRQLLSTFLAGNNMYATEILRRIELKWPHVCCQMQNQLFDILVNIFERMDSNSFKPLSNRVFIFIAECVESTNIKLADAALDVWQTASLDNWIGQNARAAIHAMFEPVSTLIEKHWNKTSIEKGSAAMTEMCRINKHSYHKMKMYQKQLKAQRYKPRVPNDCQRGWASIAKRAVELGDKSFVLNDKLKEFHAIFHNEKKPTLAVSRFIPILEKDKKGEKD